MVAFSIRALRILIKKTYEALSLEDEVFFGTLYLLNLSIANHDIHLLFDYDPHIAAFIILFNEFANNTFESQELIEKHQVVCDTLDVLYTLHSGKNVLLQKLMTVYDLASFYKLDIYVLIPLRRYIKVSKEVVNSIITGYCIKCVKKEPFINSFRTFVNNYTKTNIVLINDQDDDIKVKYMLLYMLYKDEDLITFCGDILSYLEEKDKDHNKLQMFLIKLTLRDWHELYKPRLNPYISLLIENILRIEVLI